MAHSHGAPRLEGVAIRVHGLEAMAGFYAQAFGAEFEAVSLGGLRCRVADLAGCKLKLVPLRGATEVSFEASPVHQRGFEVADVEAVVGLELKHGGRAEGGVRCRGTRRRGAVRDADGNSIKLSSPT